MPTRRNRSLDEWAFSREGDVRTVEALGSLSSARGGLLHRWAFDGHGVSMEAAWDVADDLAPRALVALPPNDRLIGLDLFATFLPRKLLPPRVRLHVNFLTEVLAP